VRQIIALDPRCPAAWDKRHSNRLVPTLVPRQLLGGARVGVPRAARGARHGDARAAGRELRGGRRGRGKEAVAAGAGQGTVGVATGRGMPVPDDAGGFGEAGGAGGRVEGEGELGEGVVRLMGGRRTRVEV
jgi:hypothetical protein